MTTDIDIKVYYHDTDAGGVVYYGRYLNYLEEGRTEFFEKKGVSIRELHNEGFLYAVRTCNLAYKAPARYGDTLECRTSVRKITAAQILFEQKIYNKETEALLLEAEVSLVSLNKDFKPSAIPDPIRQRIE